MAHGGRQAWTQQAPSVSACASWQPHAAAHTGAAACRHSGAVPLRSTGSEVPVHLVAAAGASREGGNPSHTGLLEGAGHAAHFEAACVAEGQADHNAAFASAEAAGDGDGEQDIAGASRSRGAP